MPAESSLAALSILRNFDNATIYEEPYPYIVIKDALPSDLYETLESTFPDPELVINGREVKDTWYDYPACNVIEDTRLTDLWQDFFRYHVSGEFYRELVQKLGPQILDLHPDLEAKVGKNLSDFAVGMRPGGRGNPFADNADISMECQFYVNLTRQPRAVRGPHVDRPTELFAGLLYFRHSDDDSTGGDLAVDRLSDPTVLQTETRLRIDRLPMEVGKECVTVCNTVEYAPNTLVLFLNSARSIHEVTPRSPTDIPRRHINFCGDITHDLFELDIPMRLRLKDSLSRAPVLWRLADRL